jgi:hypothetical protein
MAGKRSPAEELRERLRSTEEALVTCASERAVRELLRTKYGVRTRSVRRWIRAVRKQWAAEGTQEQRAAHRIEQRARYRATLLEILARAITSGDLKAATSAVDRLIKLDALDQVPAPTPARALSDEELARELAAELVKRTGGELGALRKIKEASSR